jgi:16S rRNA (guanine527-N7)-methyltransferase
MGIPEGERAAGLLEKFLAEIEKWNPRFALVKADRKELVVKHALDSLCAWETVRDIGETVLDIGSGAGFPGIPLAIALPALSFTLLERSSKRAAFLKNCVILLGLSNVKVVESDLSALQGEFDVVTFRAFASLDEFFGDLACTGLTWRAVVAYKGRAERVREELAIVKEKRMGFSGLMEVRRVEVPFLQEERHLVVIRAASR